MSKIDLISQQWCDLVFEGRNKSYGAYKLRSQAGRRQRNALVAVLIFIAVIALIPVILQVTKSDTAAEDNYSEVMKMAQLKQEKKEDGFIHLLFMGLLVKEKGIYDLLDVIAVHHEELSHLIKLHIGGNGDVASLLRYIKEHELNDCVIYEGWVSGEKKSRLLSQCDIYVLPSYIEGLPLSILEAMSYGCPIMATEVGGIPEIVWNGKNGFLIKPGDKNGMYDRLSRLIQDDILRARMGEDARERALNNSPQSVKKELLTVYNQLLKN